MNTEARSEGYHMRGPRMNRLGSIHVFLDRTPLSGLRGVSSCFTGSVQELPPPEFAPELAD